MTNGAPRGRESLLAAVFYAALTVLMTWPQTAHLSNRTTDLGDAKLEAWVLQWDFRQTLRDPLNLFQAPIFHPARYALAFSENNYGGAIFGFPLLAAGAPAWVNYNVNLLLAMLFSAWACWRLASYVTGDPAASLAAGVVFAFLPYKISQLVHLHMEWGGFFCLECLFLLRYLDLGRRRDAVLLAVFFAWNGIACFQYGFFGGLLIGVVLLFEAVTGADADGPERWRRIGGAVLALAVGTLIWLPFLLPYRTASRLLGMRRGLTEMTYFSGRPGAFLSAGDRNRLYGPLTRRWRSPEGDFFPGLLALLLAAVAVWRVRVRVAGPRAEAPPPLPSPARRRLARILDVVALVLAAGWIAAVAIPGFHLGPVRIGDPSRLVVLLTAAVLARLVAAFPGRGAFRDLGDRVRRSTRDRRVILLLTLVGAGVLIALGGRTPYYRFLFQSFGDVFRAVRAAARGIVIAQLALAVLAAWGLSAWTRGLSRGVRRAAIGGALAILIFEYRAFPVDLFPCDPNPRPVYQWVRSASFTGGLVEWPLGIPHDVDYVLSQGEHEKPLVNGYSGLWPREYSQLVETSRLRPIPERIWGELAGRDSRIVVYHPHEMLGPESFAYLRLVREGLEQGRLELLGSALHGERRDFLFRLHVPAASGAAAGEVSSSGFSEAERADAAARLQALFDQPAAEVSPPIGVIHLPGEGASVAAGSWGMGWAVDDSGIAEIRVESELGRAGVAKLGGAWPGLAEAYPNVMGSASGGFGFSIPAVPPGPQTLRVTFVA
ncbi:MAG TPA: hypothetical protein VGO79_16230, partial [Thermoanaerobaculia bacterium]